MQSNKYQHALYWLKQVMRYHLEYVNNCENKSSLYDDETNTYQPRDRCAQTTRLKFSKIVNKMSTFWNVFTIFEITMTNAFK